MDEFIVKQLKNLKRVKPSASWLESQKSFLLSRISNQEIKEQEKIEKKKSFAFFPVFNFSKILKPAFALTFSLVVLISSLGTVGVISAAQNSLPGDPLYVLKTAFEKTQITLASGETNKVKLSIKFANQRIDEVTQLVDKSESKENIQKTVKSFTNQLTNVQNSMDKLKAMNIEKAAEIAQIIQDQTAIYEQALIKTNDQLAYIMPEGRENLKAEIDQALSEINKIQEQTQTLIKDASEDAEDTNEEILVPEEDIERPQSPSIDFENIINQE